MCLDIDYPTTSNSFVLRGGGFLLSSFRLVVTGKVFNLATDLDGTPYPN